MFLLQNSNLSVEAGKMRESLSSVNWCNVDWKKRPYLFYIPLYVKKALCGVLSCSAHLESGKRNSESSKRLSVLSSC